MTTKGDIPLSGSPALSESGAGGAATLHPAPGAYEARVASSFHEIAKALGSRLERDQLLSLVLEKISLALLAEETSIHLLDAQGAAFTRRILRGQPAKEIHLPVSDDVLGRVARLAKSEQIAHAPHAGSHNGESFTMLASPMKNHEGRIIGVAVARTRSRSTFTPADAEVLAAMAALSVIAIDNSELVATLAERNIELTETTLKLERHVADLRLLFDLERAMVRATTLEELFLSTLTRCMAAFSATRGAIALVDKDFDPDMLFAIDDKHQKLTHLASNDYGLLDYAVRHSAAVIPSDLPSDSFREARNEGRYEDGAVAKGHGRSRSGIAVPLEGEHGNTVGALALYERPDGRPFTTDDKGLLRLIAANVATSLQLHVAREAREHEDRLTTIGRLLSGVIHDLKTPLTIISGYIQLMQHEAPQAERDKYANLALTQFDYISAMQRDVLEFARGETSILVRRVYLHRFFEQVKTQLDHSLARQHVELVLEIQDRLVGHFDESKMLRLVHNLSRNAMEAMAPDGGKLTIRVRREPETGFLLFSFGDTGPGIPHEVAHRLFQAFATSGKSNGTGLGLAIVKQIAEEHGGEVSVASTNKGATFTVRIPQPPPRA